MIIEPHPLLAQVPLTVSPFISLPTAPTLPYTYKPLPSTLPPSSTANPDGTEREKYVVAPSGHAAHPDEIIASCQALQAHIQKVHEDADKAIQDWERSLKEEDLMEKRKLAPGWLDSNEKILEPERKTAGGRDDAARITDQVGNMNLMDHLDDGPGAQASNDSRSDEAGEALDRAFGGMGIGNR